MATKTRRLPEKQDVGALVFIFAQTDGQFGIVSTDRSVESWGRSLDDCWPKYFTKASRAMKKREREIAEFNKKNSIVPETAAPVCDTVSPVAPDADEFVET